MSEEHKALFAGIKLQGLTKISWSSIVIDLENGTEIP